MPILAAINHGPFVYRTWHGTNFGYHDKKTTAFGTHNIVLVMLTTATNFSSDLSMFFF